VVWRLLVVEVECALASGAWAEVRWAASAGFEVETIEVRSDRSEESALAAIAGD
jgi:hypothetical protein